MHQSIFDELKIVKIEEQNEDRWKFCQMYNLTHSGQPIVINEYCTRLARGPSTHVIQLDDF